jgi:hypothetical protein
VDFSSLNQFFLAFVLLIPIVIIARTVVAGTKYSPILIIVVFGLFMGFLLERSGMATPGLAEFTMVGFMSSVTVVVLIVTFFVGGQELRKLVKKNHLEIEDLVVPSEEEVILGTKRTQLFFIVRSFFILIAVQGTYKIILGGPATALTQALPLLTYLGLMGALIIIDSKAKIKSKPQYLLKGIVEMVVILLILLASYFISQWIKGIIALPQIFFAMLISAGLGFSMSNWKFGPTMRSLLFAGIPVVLAAVFLIGGSRILEAFSYDEMYSVMGYGFFGQLLWMFGGIFLLIFFGKANHVRNLAPGMAGSLSHSGLTGACTAGDLGHEASARTPIMINIPFFGHIFVFTILALSAKRGSLLMIPAALVVALGAVLTYFALKTLRSANREEVSEVRGLMLFSFGWQLMAVFGSFLLLEISGMPIFNASMATSSAISHFGLFAAVQGGMFGAEAADMIPFIFAMPFLVHPIVFGMFGRAMKKDGVMPFKPVILFVILGLIGSGVSLFVL